MIKLKKIAVAGFLWAVTLGCAGCGVKADMSKFSENTLAVNKDGSVTELAVESFGEAYYSLDDLKTYVNAQVDAYNSAHPPASGKEKDKTITVDEVAVDEENARVVLTYESSQDYADFNYTKLEVINGAKLSGDAAALSLKDADGAEAGNLSGLEKPEDYEAVVVYTAQNIVVPGKIAYVSSNVTVLDQSLAQGDGTLAVILYH